MTTFVLTAWACLGPLAAAAPPADGAKGGNPLMQSLLFIFVMFFILYFLMIRPQRKRQRERGDMLTGLSKGDQVVTTGGIKGTITLVRDHEVVVKVDDNVKLTVLKTGVARVVGETGNAADSKN